MKKGFKPTTQVENGLMKKRFKAIVDIIENDVVFMTPIGDHDLKKIAVPLCVIPDKIRRGEFIDVRMTIDTEKPETARRRVAAIVRQLMS